MFARVLVGAQSTSIPPSVSAAAAAPAASSWTSSKREASENQPPALSSPKPGGRSVVGVSSSISDEGVLEPVGCCVVGVAVAFEAGLYRLCSRGRKRAASSQYQDSWHQVNNVGRHSH